MTLYITPALCLEHETPPNEPDRPARLQAIDRRLKSGGLIELLHGHATRDATTEELARCHGEDYIRRVEAACAWIERQGVSIGRLSPDTFCSAGTYRAAGLQSPQKLEFLERFTCIDAGVPLVE